MNTEEQDEIIVLQHFERSIDASLAKTKLDAHGIPCFLTGENLNDLYPLQNKHFGVRLHIFSKDQQTAEEILSELHKSEEEIIACPKCDSKNVKVEQVEKIEKTFWKKIASILAIILFPLPRTYRCQDCEHEF